MKTEIKLERSLTTKRQYNTKFRFVVSTPITTNHNNGRLKRGMCTTHSTNWTKTISYLDSPCYKTLFVYVYLWKTLLAYNLQSQLLWASQNRSRLRWQGPNLGVGKVGFIVTGTGRVLVGTSDVGSVLVVCNKYNSLIKGCWLR